MKKLVFFIVAVIMCISFVVSSMASENMQKRSLSPDITTPVADNSGPHPGFDPSKIFDCDIIFEGFEDTQNVKRIDDNGKTSINVTIKAPAGAEYAVYTDINGVRGPLPTVLSPATYTISLTKGVEYTTESTATGLRITIDTSKIEKDGRDINLLLTVTVSTADIYRDTIARESVFLYLEGKESGSEEETPVTYPDGFNYVNGKWGWYKDGSLQTSMTGIIKGTINGKESWYYVSGGIMKTGWVSYKNKAYYFDPSTGEIQTGWVKYGNKYCYLDPSTGARKTGWVKYDGKYYYFHPTTGFLKTGWLKYGGKYYYLSPKTGNPVTGKQKIGGKTYTFNSKGVCVG